MLVSLNDSNLQDSQAIPVRQKSRWEIKSFDPVVQACTRDTIYSPNNNILRKSTDEGLTWITLYTFAGTYIRWIWATKSGYILVWTGDKNLYRSTDGGTTFSVVLSNVNYPLHNGIDEKLLASSPSVIIWGEYQTASDPVRVYKSTDEGATWTVAKDFAGAVRHVHSVNWDSRENKWWVTTGDSDLQVKVLTSVDDGAAFTEIALTGTTKQDYRTLGYVFTDKNLIWASDSPDTQNHVFTAPKSDINNYQSLALMPAAVYFIAQFGNTLLIGTNAEGYATEDWVARLYASYDLGKTWEIIYEWAVQDGQTNAGFKTIVKATKSGWAYVRGSGLVGQGAPSYTKNCLAVRVIK